MDSNVCKVLRTPCGKDCSLNFHCYVHLHACIKIERELAR